MPSNVIIRTATLDEREALEALQLRASLTNEGDREAPCLRIQMRLKSRWSKCSRARICCVAERRNLGLIGD